jgi:phage N-6-adenine-methyltransferase
MAGELSKTLAHYGDKAKIEEYCKQVGHDQAHKELQEKLAETTKPKEEEKPESKQGKLAGLYSSKKHNWLSPPDLVEALKGPFNLELDPCTTTDNPLGFKYFITKEQNSLDKDWLFNAYVNPPFNMAQEFTKKCMLESARQKTTIVEILANRTETVTYQAFGKYAEAFCLINKRVAFIDADTNQQMQQPNFGSILLIFRPDPLTSDQLDLLNSLGFVLGKYKQA